MRLRLAVFISVLVLAPLTTVSASISITDARYVYAEKLTYHSQLAYELTQIVLFPDIYSSDPGMLTPSIKSQILPLACNYDHAIIQVSEEYSLDYDRSWLLYWFPEQGTLGPKTYITLLYYGTFMPPAYRGIIYEQGYSIGGFIPEYLQGILNNWDNLFRLYTNGYIYDPFIQESVYSPQQAEKAIVNLRRSFADYLGLDQ